jgi:hypothetical protein
VAVIELNGGLLDIVPLMVAEEKVMIVQSCLHHSRRIHGSSCQMLTGQE